MKNNFQHYCSNFIKSSRNDIFCYSFSLKILLLVIASSMVNQSVAAPTIFLDGPDRIGSGVNFEVTIGISGLEEDDDLGAFSFDFLINPKETASFLPFNSSFGDQLGYPLDSIGDIDDSDIGDIQKLEIAEVSLLPDLSGQLDEFTLFTVGLFAPRFPGPANKTLTVSANNFVLSDALGFAIDKAFQTLPNGNIIEVNTDELVVGKNIVVVPEPPLILLFILGLIGIKLSTSNYYQENYNEN